MTNRDAIAAMERKMIAKFGIPVTYNNVTFKGIFDTNQLTVNEFGDPINAEDIYCVVDQANIPNAKSGDNFSVGGDVNKSFKIKDVQDKGVVTKNLTLTRATL